MRLLFGCRLSLKCLIHYLKQFVRLPVAKMVLYAHSSFSSLVQSLLPKDTLLRTFEIMFHLLDDFLAVD